LASDKVDAVIRDKIKDLEIERARIQNRHAQELNDIDGRITAVTSALGLVDDRMLQLIQKLSQTFDLSALLKIT
jgi:hypothetical protein